MNIVEWSQVLGNFGELLGAIAVVITIAFLTSQIRQNTRALRSNAREFGSNAYNVMATTILPDTALGDLLAKAQHASPADFTPGERVRVSWFFAASLKSAETQHINWTDGMLDDDLYHPMLVGLDRLITNHPNYAPRVWSATRSQFSASFQDILDPIVEKLSTEPKSP